uniref:Geranylgeranyl transferase type-2 subunit beta n=1 Tax=Rhabditophanes sp. KR3021 TaxID=114890 RepID=A0AC35UF64_9BILA
MSLAEILDMCKKDVSLKQNSLSSLLENLHSEFILKYSSNKDSFDYVMSAHLRMSGIYWCCGALDMEDQLGKTDREDIIKFILGDCFDKESGGFRSAVDHGAHLLQTLSAVQILIMFDALHLLDKDAVVKYVKARIDEDGGVSGDQWGEIDTRFSFCAVATLHLIGRLDDLSDEVKNNLWAYVRRSYNYDGGFGTRPKSESHAGQVYCCVATLAIMKKLDCIDIEKTASWLSDRQCKSGGLNGRPDKLPDVCYGWWVLSSLAIIGKLDWIDKKGIMKFVYASQDDETGGFADRPGDYPDPFHTFFGLAALSLLGENKLEAIDPVFCMTKRCLGSLSFI